MSKLKPLFNTLEANLHKVYELKKQRSSLLDARVPSQLQVEVQLRGDTISATVDKGWLCNKLQKDIQELIESCGTAAIEAIQKFTCEEKGIDHGWVKESEPKCFKNENRKEFKSEVK